MRRVYIFGDDGFQSRDCAHGVASDGTCLAHEKGVYFFDNEFQRRDCKHGVALDGTCMENKTKESGLYYYDDVLKTLTLDTRKAAEGEERGSLQMVDRNLVNAKTTYDNFPC